MQATVIIPTFGRPEKVCNCVRALASQSIDPGAFEVIVTIDGRDQATARAIAHTWEDAGAEPGRLRVLEGDHAGAGAARNRAIDAANGRVLIFFNDDVVPHRDCVHAHLHAHRERRSSIIIGDSPWRVPSPDNLFAQLLRETSMVFFYNRMKGQDPGRDWGYRHAWMLNVSMPAEPVRSIGGIRVAMEHYGREDDELAFRLTRAFDMPVLYRPGAVAEHDHPMTPAEYLRREYEQGYGSPTFARFSPQCAVDMFQRDILSTRERADCVAFLGFHRPAAGTLEWFLDLGNRPRTRTEDLEGLYQRHLPLKRFVFRTGLLDALEKKPMDADAVLTSLRNSRLVAA